MNLVEAPQRLGAVEQAVDPPLHEVAHDERQQQVLEKLKETACWDGMYNEAIDEITGEIRSRYWFSWPGAFIGCGLRLIRNPTIN